MVTPAISPPLQRKHRPDFRILIILWILTVLFALRVVAQPLALVVPVLPEFRLWHGGAMPYPFLLVLQSAILLAMTGINLHAGRAGLPYRPRVGQGLMVFGAMYFSAMIGRLIVGQVFDTTPSWFDRPLPSLFHLVLASWLLIVSRLLGRARA